MLYKYENTHITFQDSAVKDHKFESVELSEIIAPALYFGTTTGQLWIGREGGETFDCLFDSLPPIHNVKVAVV